MNWMGKRKTPPIRSLIGEGTVVHGSVLFGEGLRIDGEVHGDVTASGSDGGSILVVGEKATVRGRVSAAHVIVNGAIDGPVHCEQLLELHPKARVVGDVRYELLEMHPGAIVEGELRPLKSADKPALKLAVSNDA